MNTSFDMLQKRLKMYKMNFVRGISILAAVNSFKNKVNNVISGVVKENHRSFFLFENGFE